MLPPGDMPPRDPIAPIDLRREASAGRNQEGNIVRIRVQIGGRASLDKVVGRFGKEGEGLR